MLEIIKYATRDFWTFAAVAFLFGIAVTGLGHLAHIITGTPPRSDDQ